MKHLHIALIRYGIELLQKGLCLPQAASPEGEAARRARETEPDPGVEARLARARKIVGERPDIPSKILEAGLRSPFCGIGYGEKGDKSLPAFTLPLKRLDTDLEVEESQPGATAARREKATSLWEDFRSDVARIHMPEGAEKWAFETFFAALCKYGWYVRGTTDHADISVFEQFKAVTALACCLPVPETEEVLLVAGDIPGIQRILYTITSKGAARSLRGRSFYLQILNDVLVRAILRELDLPSACVITNAGGNFKLLVPREHKDRLAELERDLNRRLLRFHKGEISLALAWAPVAAERVMDSGGFTEAMTNLGERLQKAKRQPFSTVAKEDYGGLFGVRGTGTIARCEVCHEETRHKRPKAHGGPAGAETAGDERPSLCLQCKSFEQLAGQIALTCEKTCEKTPWLAIEEDTRPLSEILIPPRPDDEPASLVDVLKAFGTELTLGQDPWKMAKPVTHLYRLNSTEDFIPALPWVRSSFGFRFLANLTPRIGKDEIHDLKKYFKAQTDDGEEAEMDIREGAIRDTGIMAAFDATGIDRFGILRMDVDDLSRVFRETLRQRDMMHVSALSGFLGLFFEGWLNHLCLHEAKVWEEKAKEATVAPDCNTAKAVKRRLRDKTPYILYSGGDDLFIVGTWDVLPHLAWCIRRDLGEWINKGAVSRSPGDLLSPTLTLSAGIYADARKFPIYRAAELAHEALASSKSRVIIEGAGEKTRTVKDGVTCLGITLGWKEFRHAFDLALVLARLVNVGERLGEGKEKEYLQAPHSLLWFLRSVAAQYQKDAELSYSPGRVVYGRWMWLLAYGQKQMRDRLKGKGNLAEAVSKVLGESRDLGRTKDAAEWRTIEYLDLPVRWAELLIRGEETTDARKQGE